MHSTYWQWRTITQRYTDKHRRYVIFRNGHDRIGYERSGACRQQIYIYPIFNTVGQRSEREFQPETHHPAFFLSSLLPSLSLLSLISLSLARSIAPLANARLCTRSAPMGARLHVNAIQLSIRCTAIEFYSSQWGYLGLEECIIEEKEMEKLFVHFEWF